MSGSEALADVPVPPGYLSRRQQAAWRRLVRAILFRAVLDAAHHPARSTVTRAALAYLRDPDLEPLLDWCGGESGWTGDSVRRAVRTRRRLKETARSVRQYLLAEGHGLLLEWHARRRMAAEGASADRADRPRGNGRAGRGAAGARRTSGPALASAGAGVAARAYGSTAGSVRAASGLDEVAA